MKCMNFKIECIASGILWIIYRRSSSARSTTYNYDCGITYRRSSSARSTTYNYDCGITYRGG